MKRNMLAREFETEFEQAAPAPAIPGFSLPPAEAETGRGAATALLQLLHTIENANGLLTPEQQQAVLRVGLAQANAANQSLRQVGVPGVVRRGTLNKPDVAYVFHDSDPRGRPLQRRMNIEIDTNPNESRRHQAIVNGRDPQARNLYVVVHPWTGQPISAQVREPGARRMTRVPISQLASLFQTLPRVAVPGSARRFLQRGAGFASGPRIGVRRASNRLREFETGLESGLESAAAALESGEVFATRFQGRFPSLPGYAEGHEELTRRAAAGLLVDLPALLRGVRRPDVGSGSVGDIARSVQHVSDPVEQKRHALRRLGTNTATALAEIRDYFVRLYYRAMHAVSRSVAFEQIGEALHLLQDSYSEAHTERAWRRGSNAIVYVRAYYLGGHAPYRTSGTTEHNAPSDPRDRIWISPRMLKFSARKARDASRDFLQLMLRHLGGPITPGKLADLKQFMDQHLA